MEAQPEHPTTTVPANSNTAEPIDFKLVKPPTASQNPSGSATPLTSSPNSPVPGALGALQSGGKQTGPRWPETTLRIKFPDGTQLEQVFPSTTKIAAVYAFVQNCLEEDAKRMQFTLYQLPKLDLKISDPKVSTQSLRGLQLAPSSMLFVRFEDEAMNHKPTPLYASISDTTSVSSPLPSTSSAVVAPAVDSEMEAQPEEQITTAPVSDITEPVDFKLFRPVNSSQNPYGSRPTPSRTFPEPGALGAKTHSGVKPAGARWPETTLRIKFPDSTQLEKVFPSTTKIGSVYAFVQNCLKEDAKQMQFTLYQLPRLDLKMSDPKISKQNLRGLQLAPSSMLFIRFEDEVMNHEPAPLAAFVLYQAVDFPQAIPYPDPPASSRSNGLPIIGGISKWLGF